MGAPRAWRVAGTSYALSSIVPQSELGAASFKPGNQHMSVILLNAMAAIVFLLVILSVWTAVHMLSRKRLGERSFSCRGGIADADGNVTCCHGQSASCKAQTQND